MCDVTRNENGKLDTYAWPGGYPIFYLTEDCGTLCPACANGENDSLAYTDQPADESDRDAQWHIVACDCNWEDESMYCDHCNRHIESAYGDDEQESA